jgi:sugar phosphate isomerase/epimerase
MKMKFFCPIWGMVPDYIHNIEGSLELVFEKIKNAGYDGIEMAIPLNDKQKREIIDLKKAYELDLIALQYSANGNNLAAFIECYKEYIISACDVEPILINSHTGTDFFKFEDNCKFIQESMELSKKLGIKILHETHRGRFSFHSCTIQKYLSTFPELRLTADFSHWCNVSESFLENQFQNLSKAIERVDHIHARVGHPQSCQVNDPRAPEWKVALNHHLEWWDKIIKTKLNLGSKVFTITPEFGPANYMPTLPYTLQPLSDQWDINLWMKDLLKERYAF